MPGRRRQPFRRSGPWGLRSYAGAATAVLAMMIMAVTGWAIAADPTESEVAISGSLERDSAPRPTLVLGDPPVVEAVPPDDAGRAPRRSSSPEPTPDVTPGAPAPTTGQPAQTPAPHSDAPTTSPIPADPAVMSQGRVLYVATDGSDSNRGTADRPFRTVEHALGQLQPGDTLYLRGGTYVEDIEADLSAGRPDAPILVSAMPGERPVIQGLVSLRNPRYVTLDQFNVTWNTGEYDEHMFKITGGTGWTLQHSEIWGARSFANLLISGSPQGWAVRYNTIHDTYGGESDVNRSHNVYANTGLDANGGVIERNLLFNATHGTNLKLAGPGGSDTGAANVVVRHNTLHNATQPLMIGDGSRNLTIERNIIGGSARGNLVRLYELTGGNIVVRDNLGWAGSEWCDDYDSSVSCSEVNGQNVFPRDPRFDRLDAGGFRPADATAAKYGRYAP